MDRFDDFALNKKIKHHYKYSSYLKSLYNYLASFIKRSKPLFDFDNFMKEIEKSFEEKFSNNKMPGWEE